MSSDPLTLERSEDPYIVLTLDGELRLVSVSVSGSVHPLGPELSAGCSLESFVSPETFAMARTLLEPANSGRYSSGLSRISFGETDRDERITLLSLPSGSPVRMVATIGVAGTFETLFQHAPVGLFSLDEDARFLEVNQATLDMLGRGRNEVLGTSLIEFLASGYRRRHEAAVKRLSRVGSISELEYTVIRPDEALRDVLISANAERDGRGRVMKLVGSMVDVTEKKEIERAYRQVDQRYKLLFDRNLAGVFRCTLDGKVYECNEAFARILGFPDRLELLEHGHADLYVDEEEQRDLYRRLRRRKSIFGVELALKKRDGEPIWTLQNLSIIATDSSVDPIVEGTLFDITERRIAQEKVQYQALHDPLTGLPNPRLFTSRMEEILNTAQATGEQAVILFVDLDGFKAINDTMGHAVGNELLQLAAMRMQKVLRSNDIVSRLGGDEFTLGGIVQGLEGATVLSEKVLERLGQPFLLRGKNLYVTASIGLALSPENGTSPEELLKAADIAMYAAKEAGRNRVEVSSTTTTQAAVSRMELEADLHRALERDELELYYQPLVLAESSEIVGVEALIRWNHPERGLLLPDEFIPLAERTGLILPIGDWVLRTSTLQIRKWIDSGYPTRVAVNISPRQFRSETFADEIAALLEERRIPASSLELEVTEGMAMDNPEAALLTLTRLKKMGVRISIDDFGTGYSSLSYLTRFPVDTIKIDRVFVEELADENSESAIISAVIALARQLNLEVVAEGVENQTQSDFLKRESCQKLQGYLFGHPIPLDQIDLLIRQQ